MLIAALLLSGAQASVATITLDRVTALPPAEAGALALAGRAHGPIVEVTRQDAASLLPPGVVEVAMVEAPVATRGGCSRRRWATTFRFRSPAKAGSAVLASAVPRLEVAVDRNGVCPSAGYAHVNPGVSEEDAFAALHRLADVLMPASRTRLTCVDRTGSSLCGRPKEVRRRLAALSPWAVTRRGDAMILWLGIPGQVVTEVSYNPAEPRHVRITREVPPPA